MRFCFVQFGGWYADVDYVFLKSMRHVHSVVVGTSSDANRNRWWLTNSM